MKDDSPEILGAILTPSQVGKHQIHIPGYTGYIWDVENDCVVSLRNYGKPYRMKRNSPFPPDCDEPHYRLLPTSGEPRKSVRLSELRALEYMKPNLIIIKKREEHNMKTGNYIIGSITKSNGRFSTTEYPATHSTRPEAVREAERLAKIAPEKKFVVLSIDGIVHFNDVVWE